MIVLTADLGNSRLKARLWRVEGIGARELLAEADFDGRLRLPERLLAFARGAGPIERAALVSVAEPALERAIARALERHVEIVQRTPSCGLEILCRVPEKVGQDRLFAARGALVRCQGSAIVVDAGTALTVDAVIAKSGDDGLFLGGAIAAGPSLLADALSRGTARLPRIVACPGAAALGRDTEGAIEAGVVVGFRGAARELVTCVAREADLENAPVVLTGGAREFLLTPAPFIERELVIEPQLVHLGLLAALLEPPRTIDARTRSDRSRR